LARADIEDLKGLRKGTVAIGATEGVAAEFLPRVLTDFNKRHPGISFTVNVVSGDRLIDALRGNEVDIGFMFNPPEKAGVNRAASISLQIGAVMKPSHPLAKHRRLRLAQCQPYPVILPDMEFPNRAWLDAAMADSSLQFHVAVCTNSFQLMRELAREGMGIAFQTAIGIEDELRAGDLVHVVLKDVAVKPSVFVALVRAKQQLHVAASMFLEGIRRSFEGAARARPASRPAEKRSPIRSAKASAVVDG